MSWSYSCPHCHVMLNPEKAVILIAGEGPELFLIGLHPEPGNYEVHLPPGVTPTPGNRWEFHCPACQRSLVTEEVEHLCALDMESGGARHRVYFSPVAGEHATFVLSAEGIRTNYGEDFMKYVREVGWGPQPAPR